MKKSNQFRFESRDDRSTGKFRIIALGPVYAGEQQVARVRGVSMEITNNETGKSVEVKLTCEDLTRLTGLLMDANDMSWEMFAKKPKQKLTKALKEVRECKWCSPAESCPKHALTK